jgi:hypothetical protein
MPPAGQIGVEAESQQRASSLEGLVSSIWWYVPRLFDLQGSMYKMTMGDVKK